MKETYLNAILEVIELNGSDIVTTSPAEINPNDPWELSGNDVLE